MPSIYQRYLQVTKLPAGHFIFSKLVGFGAPFFGKIHPSVISLAPAHCVVRVKDRRSIHNHMGTINAGALCSLAEMTGGMALDATLDNRLRWIPKAMTVKYIAKATGTITGESQFDASGLNAGDFAVPVIVRNAEGQTVFTADITFYLSPFKPKS